MIDEIANPRPVMVGEHYDGTVVKTTTFGAFVNLGAGPRRPGPHLQARHAASACRASRRRSRKATRSTVEVQDIDAPGKISLEARRRGVGRSPRGLPSRRSAGIRPCRAAIATAIGGSGDRDRRPRDRERRTALIAAVRRCRSDAPSSPPACASSPSGCPASARWRWASGSLAGSRDERAADQSARATSSSTCCSRDEDPERAATSREAFDAVGGDLNAFTAKEYTCVLRARCSTATCRWPVDHLADMLQHSVIRSARPRRRAAGDPRGDQHARGRSRRPRARPVHRDAVARIIRSAARSSAPSRASRPPRATQVQPLLPAALRRRQRGRQCCGRQRPARRRCSRSCATRMDAGRALPRRRLERRNLRSAGRRPARRGARWSRQRKTEQAHICLGPTACRASDPDRFAFRRSVNTALGGGMSLAAVPGDPREARTRVLASTATTRMYTEAGRVLRRTPAPRRRGRRRCSADHAARARGRRPAAASTEEEFERRAGPREGVARAWRSRTRAAACRGWASPEIAHGEILTVSQTLGAHRARHARRRAPRRPSGYCRSR